MGKAQQYIESLDRLKHRVGENAQWTLFPEPGDPTPDDNTEYWIWSDLYNLAGAFLFDMVDDPRQYIWDAFDFETARRIPQLKNYSCSQILSRHVCFFDHDYRLDMPGGCVMRTNAPDARVSRYAFYSMISKKFENPLGNLMRAYLINTDGNIQKTDFIANQFARVRYRDNLSQLERVAFGIAHKNNISPRQLTAAAHRAFYSGTSIAAIKAAHRISARDNDPIANYMGAKSLRMRTTGLAHAIRQYDDGRGRMNFERIMCHNMYVARNEMIKHFHTRPECDISRDAISATRTKLKQMENEFIFRAAQEHIK